MGMSVVYARCAGLDFHKRTVVACLLLTPASGKVSREVRTFATTTAGQPERDPCGHGKHRHLLATSLQPPGGPLSGHPGQRPAHEGGAGSQDRCQRLGLVDRFCKEQQPRGDPDCRVGVKRSTNRELPNGSAKEVKEYLWGYGSGVAAATVADYGDVVLAEFTQPFNQNDVTSFRPLYQRTVITLEQFPTHVTADAAFDAWYVYECPARHGGIGAVPLNEHSHASFGRAPDGTPRCEQGLLMQPKYQFDHTNG